MSAYIRGIKESSLPTSIGRSNNGNATSGHEEAKEEEKAFTCAAAVETAPTEQGQERRDSAVALAAKRVAMRKRKEKAANEARIQVITRLSRLIGTLHVCTHSLVHPVPTLTSWSFSPTLRYIGGVTRARISATQCPCAHTPQEETAKKAAKRAFEGGLRAIVAKPSSSATLAGGQRRFASLSAWLSCNSEGHMFRHSVKISIWADNYTRD